MATRSTAFFASFAFLAFLSCGCDSLLNPHFLSGKGDDIRRYDSGETQAEGEEPDNGGADEADEAEGQQDVFSMDEGQEAAAEPDNGADADCDNQCVSGQMKCVNQERILVCELTEDGCYHFRSGDEAGAYTCSDGVDATDDWCEADECRYAVNPAYCLIESNGYKSGEKHGYDPCLECNPKVAQSWWTTVPGCAPPLDAADAGDTWDSDDAETTPPPTPDADTADPPPDEGSDTDDTGIEDADDGEDAEATEPDNGPETEDSLPDAGCEDECTGGEIACTLEGNLLACEQDNAGCWIYSEPAACGDDNPCTDDLCVPGTGCVNDFNSLSCDDGDACTENDTCAAGICAGANWCDCQLEADCVKYEDEDLCNGTLVCVSGQCVADPATVIACNTANDGPCAAAACDPASGQCYPASVADGTDCDDGDACTAYDQCLSGACAGEQMSCDDGNACTDDACDPAKGCIFTSNTAPCSDNNVCTVNDACDDGACAAGKSSLQCDDGNYCTVDVCLGTKCQSVALPPSTPCDDGNACTLGDMCLGGVCAGGKAAICAAPDQCHEAGACDPKTGACSHPEKPEGTLCNDANACTQVDQCHQGACLGGDPVLCTALDQCHAVGVCDPQSGLCSDPAKANGAACDDSNACTSTDKCAAGNCGGVSIVCDDGNPCTNDSCDPATGCKFTPNTAPCDDGEWCTTGDVCSEGACLGTPEELICGGTCPGPVVSATGFPATPGSTEVVVDLGQAMDLAKVTVTVQVQGGENTLNLYAALAAPKDWEPIGSWYGGCGSGDSCSTTGSSAQLCLSARYLRVNAPGLPLLKATAKAVTLVK